VSSIGEQRAGEHVPPEIGAVDPRPLEPAERPADHGGEHDAAGGVEADAHERVAGGADATHGGGAGGVPGAQHGRGERRVRLDDRGQVPQLEVGLIEDRHRSRVDGGNGGETTPVGHPASLRRRSLGPGSRSDVHHRPAVAGEHSHRRANIDLYGRY